MESHRKVIEETFDTKVYDSYGHMERTVGISHCPGHRYHIHMDYGLAQFEGPIPGQLAEVRKIIGTSLHNSSMPLIRYQTGDYAVMESGQAACPCGRGFPMVKSILGRSSDTIITPDGRAITALYVALDRTPGLDLGQIVQERRDKILARVACASSDVAEVEKILTENLRAFLGERMEIQIVHESIDAIRGSVARKFSSIASRILDSF